MPVISHQTLQQAISLLDFYLKEFSHRPADYTDFHKELLLHLKDVQKKYGTIGSRIVNLMNENKISIRKLAKATDIPVSTLGNWMQNTVPTDFEAVSRLADHFGVSLVYILVGEETK